MNYSIEGSNPTEEKNSNQINTQIAPGNVDKFTKYPRILKQTNIFKIEVERNIEQKMETKEKIPCIEIRIRLPTV